MGVVIVHSDTTKNPISLIGKYSGICYGADTEDAEKNYKRGLENIKSNHGRALENVQVYMTLDDYSAKVIREYYTHIAGSPTRLQSSSRYIDYEHGFTYVTPPTIQADETALKIYEDAMHDIAVATEKLASLKIPKEDSSMLLPLGMTTKVVVRTNLRNLIDMSRQRLCNRAFWEYRKLMSDIIGNLSNYSDEWTTLVRDLKLFHPKCDDFGYCPESRGCGRKPKKEDNV